MKSRTLDELIRDARETIGPSFRVTVEEFAELQSNWLKCNPSFYLEAPDLDSPTRTFMGLDLMVEGHSNPK